MNSKLSDTIRKALNLKHELKEPDLFGVEVEVEGLPNCTNEIIKDWNVTMDGSLRGGGSREFVLKKPLPKEDAIKAVELLYSEITKKPGKINDSMRAGVHVHLNFSDSTLLELFTFLALYYSFEIIITDEFGPDRVGNLFCLRVVDAEYISHAIINAVTTGAYRDYFESDNIRYSACNLVSLCKYGTLEFRALKTPLTAEPIVDWIEKLSKIKTLSKKFKTPAEVLANFSAGGDKEVLEEIFGRNKAREIYDTDEYKTKLLEGIRAIQLWAFFIDWE